MSMIVNPFVFGGGGGGDWLTYTSNLAWRARAQGQAYTNGQSVAALVASVGNDAVQASSSLQPVFTAASANFGGKSSITFDGSDDRMTAALSLSGAVTTLLVGRFVNGTANRSVGLYSGTGNDYDNQNVLAVYATVNTYSGGAGSSVNIAGSTDPFIVISRFNGTNSRLRHNNTTGSDAGSTWVGPMSTILIASNNAGGENTALELAELLVWNEAVPDSEWTGLVAAAAAEYSISL